MGYLFIILPVLLFVVGIAAFVYFLASARQSVPVETPKAAARETDSALEFSNLHEMLLARSRSERVVKPWIQKFNEGFTGINPASRIDYLHKLAIRASLQQTWTKERIGLVRTISTVIGVGFAFFAWISLEGTTRYLACVLCLGIGWRALDTFLEGRAQARQDAIVAELPDIADQIAISAQAGLSFEQAMRRTVSSTTGPLAEEFAWFLYDVRVGVDRETAFKRLRERIDVRDMTSFVRAISHAERSGASVADTLQIQADELRETRRQRAEEKAMRMPVTMLAPLVTCIFPPLFVALLGPAVINIMEGL